MFNDEFECSTRFSDLTTKEKIGGIVVCILVTLMTGCESVVDYLMLN